MGVLSNRKADGCKGRKNLTSFEIPVNKMSSSIILIMSIYWVDPSCRLGLTHFFTQLGRNHFVTILKIFVKNARAIKCIVKVALMAVIIRD